MALTPGTRLGPYEIIAPLGVGGMGEVYRATDTALKRHVALKVLPPDVANDPARVARFQREAEVLASLNHPNIAHLYGIEKSNGTLALAMELVEGPTLADRIASGPLPVGEALSIAQQVAEALEAAHEQGIIHRDLKPANIKLRDDGTVKVLDFGLAKAMEPASAISAMMTGAPTITTPARMTGIGMILGTAAYMAPEQAKGKPVDERADVWAFGCVLFEMLTARRAFGGDDVTETITAVLRDAPDFALLPAAAPTHVRSIVKGCLEKDVRRRWRNIGDVGLLLDGEFAAGNAGDVVSRSTPGAERRLLRAAVIVLTIVTALAVGALTLRRPADVRPVARFGLALPNVTGQFVTITPDGSKLIYVGDRGRKLYVRALDSLEPVEIATGVILTQPAVSPNGQWVSFVDESTRLRKVPTSGGPSSLVTQLDGGARGATWLTDDTIIVATAARTGLLRVSASGGPLTPITTLDGSGTDHVLPERLPGGRAVLFSIESQVAGESPDDNTQVAALDIDTGRITTLVRGGRRPRFLPGGYLSYLARGKAFAVPFDVDKLTVSPGATPIDLGLEAGPFAVSASGTLVYPTRNPSGDDNRRSLVWVDRSGRETPIAAPARRYQYPQISPDGTRVAVSATGEMNDLWIWHFGAATLTRFTLESSAETAPLWTPDGRRIVFASDRAGGIFNVWWQPADGTGSANRLTTSSASVFPSTVSPDGAQAVYWTSTPAAGRDLMMVALDGGRQVTPLVQTPADEWYGVVSPDGRWLAYESNSSGQPNVHVRPFPRTDQGQWQVTTGGGRQPLWSRDGKELFFFSTDGAVMHVPVSSEKGRFSVGTPAQLFGTRYYGSEPSALVGRTYDVSPDGQRLLMIKSEPGRNPAGASPNGDVVLVLNWADDLKRLMQKK